MGKKWIAVCAALAAVLVLFTWFLPGLFEVREAGEAYPITLVGSDVAYGPVNTDHEHLKLLDLMDPNATEWTASELTVEDLGRVIGTVGWSGEERLTGCTLYHYSRLPEDRNVFVLDDHGTYCLYERKGFFCPPNGTGTPVTETEDALCAPAILWEGWLIPEDRPGHVVSIDLGSDGVRENITLLGPADGWMDELYVTEEQPNGALNAWRFPAEAFLNALEERLEVEHPAEDRTVIRLGESITNPTAFLKEKGFTGNGAARLADGHFVGGYTLGGFVFDASLQIVEEKGACTVGTFSGCIGYENGVFTLSDWTLSGVPLD